MTSSSSSGGRIAVGLLVGVPVLIVILATLGAFTEEVIEGIPLVPGATLWAMPLDRWVRDIAAAITLGFAIMGGVLLPRPDLRLLKIASLAALVWLVALLGQVVLTVSELMGRPWGASLDPLVIQSLVSQTLLGQLLVAQIALVALVAALGWAVLGRGTGIVVVVLAGVAAMLPALSGHSGLHGGHTAASISLALHLLAVGVWVGGLIATCVYVGRGPADSDLAVRRFSALALVCVLVLGESGLVNASLRLDGIASLITTPYGTLILGKALLLAALVVLGWRQRQRVVPIAGTVDGRELLLRLAAFEVVLLGLALGLSVALSRTAPPAGAIAGDRITSGALAILTLGVPLMLVWAGARPVRLVRLTAAYPEPFAVLLLVVAFTASAFVPTGLLGVAFAALVASVLLVVAGWVFAVAAVGPRGRLATGVVMVLWPVLAWWTIRTEPVETVWQVAVAVITAEACLVLLLLLQARGRMRQDAGRIDAEGLPVA